jgi:hypothetical protein
MPTNRPDLFKRTKLTPPVFSLTDYREAKVVLRQARELLYTGHGEEKGKHRMVCLAIDKAARPVPSFRSVARKLNQLIRVRLGGAPTLRHWLKKQGYPAYDDSDLVTFRKVQDARLRWIDDLIKEMDREQANARKRIRDAQRKRSENYFRTHGGYWRRW